MLNLREQALKNMMIVAHRGAAGGNIPCNTLAAYDAALIQGADMIELDVSKSTDGVLYAFHPGMEYPHLRSAKRIDGMHSSEVAACRFVNQDGTETALGVNTLDEVFEHLKGRCFINVDKYWEHPGPITEAIRRHGIADQILVKAWPDESVVRQMEEIAPDINFMILQRDRDEWSDRLLQRNINYVGVEVVFKKDDCYLASDEFGEKMHKDNVLVWANSIVYDYQAVLSGGHSDDTAFTVSPEYGWGWMGDRPFDIIQTDWPLMLIEYLKKTGRYYRK